MHMAELGDLRRAVAYCKRARFYRWLTYGVPQLSVYKQFCGNHR
jgi:hypothetical protein